MAKKKKSSLERVVSQLEQRERWLRNFAIVLAILIVGLIGTVIGLIIALTNISNQVAQRSSTTTAANIVVEPNHDIDLSTKDTDIELNEGGEYRLTGTTSHLVNVTTDADVALHLDNVQIATEVDSAINYTGKHNLTIDLVANTKNILSSNGTGVNGGTLHSSGTLTITGTGSLETYGRGLYGNGVTTKQHFGIDSGTILSLGSDMIERPVASQQKNLSFDLDSIVQNGSIVQIQNQRGAVLHSFVTTQDFRNLIWSQPNLQDGEYSLLINGVKVKTLAI